MTRTAELSRRAWARLAGFFYLLTNATAIFSFYVAGQVIVRNDAEHTAANMSAAETWFRTGIAFELITVAGVIPLIVGLYVVLRPVDRGLAVLAAFWRLIENAILAVITLSSLAALALLHGSDYLPAADTEQWQGLMYGFLRVHTYGFQLGFFFLGLGSTIFSCLWWKSRLVPRALAGLGIFASSVMAIVALGIIVRPGLYDMLTIAYMAPMGIYEIGLGLWLLFKGIRSEPVPTGA